MPPVSGFSAPTGEAPLPTCYAHSPASTSSPSARAGARAPSPVRIHGISDFTHQPPISSLFPCVFHRRLKRKSAVRRASPPGRVGVYAHTRASNQTNSQSLAAMLKRQHPFARCVTPFYYYRVTRDHMPHFPAFAKLEHPGTLDRRELRLKCCCCKQGMNSKWEGNGERLRQKRSPGLQQLNRSCSEPWESILAGERNQINRGGDAPIATEGCEGQFKAGKRLKCLRAV